MSLFWQLSQSWRLDAQTSMWAGLVRLRPPSWACRQPAPPPSSQGRPSVCVCVLTASSHKDTRL